MSQVYHNQVPRLSAATNAHKMALSPSAANQHQATHQNGGGGGFHRPSQAEALAQQRSSQQRKWRVLVSIGLLLPALAAIIGIVAWAISIEVANSDGGLQSGGASAMAQRRGQQQQQFRRDEAAALAALVAARRQTRPEKQPHRTLHLDAAAGQENQNHRQNQQQQNNNNNHQLQHLSHLTSGAQQVSSVDAPLPLAAAVISPSPAPNTRHQHIRHQVVARTVAPRSLPSDSGQQATWRDKSADNQDTQSAPTRGTSKQQQQQLEQAAPSSMDSALLLTNLNQAEALASGAETTTSSPAPITTSESVDGSDNDELLRAGKSDQEQQTTSTTTTTTTSPQPVQTVEQLADGFEQREDDDDDSTMSSSTALEKDDSTSGQHSHGDMQFPSKPTTADASYASDYMANSNIRGAQKSRWLTSAEKRARLVDTKKVLAEKKTTNDGGLKRQSPAKVNSNKYTLVGANNNDAGATVAPPVETPPAMTQDDDVSFEAIASAISKSLRANSEADSSQAAIANSRSLLLAPMAATNVSGSGDDVAADETDDTPNSPLPPDEAQVGPDEQQQVAPTLKATNAVRRRTTGEHLAEVIDHIVEKRKQQQHLKSMQAVNQRHHEIDHLSGPHIVVVAPVGASGALLKARSLTKATNDIKVLAVKKSTEVVKKPLIEGVATKSTNGNKSTNATTAHGKPTQRLIGARLPDAIDGNHSKASEKYSERVVEVIRDDDTSNLLLAKSSSSSPLLRDNQAKQHEQERDDLFDEQVSSIHVSSHSSEPRHRAPRHEMSGATFERYSRAPVNVPFYNHHHQQQRQTSGAKLYSAEQLIRDHVLKSKARSVQQQQQQPKLIQQTSQQQRVAPQSSTASPTQVASSTSTQPPPPAPSASSSTTTTTTQQPPVREQQAVASSDRVELQAPSSRVEQQQQQHSQFQPEQQFVEQQHAPGRQFSPEMQSVHVPALFMQHQQQQAMNQHPVDPFQVIESQQQQQQAYMASEEQRQPLLPVFADQEIQVPAHMAESVIRDLQASPSTVTGMFNGRTAVFHALPAGMGPVPSATSERQHLLNAAESQRQAIFYAPAPVHYQLPSSSSLQATPPQQQQQQQQQQPSHGPFGFMSRLVAARRNQEQQYLMQQQQQARQSLANRDGATPAAKKPDADLQQLKSSTSDDSKQSKMSLIQAVKSLSNPRTLVQPIAEAAINNLFTSMSQQAAMQQAQVDAAERQQRSSPATSTNFDANNSPQQIATAGADIATSRSMRSLPIGAQAPPSQQQVQLVGTDQDAQESSYGPPMPAYHMAPGPQQHYGPNSYANDEHDKKSKGITFHFGGGPIGGGTQLITSPMGIFKHLMIPLLPNPRVNLNGKVVFGVVLEKTTAFGPPPKKKHKFWG